MAEYSVFDWSASKYRVYRDNRPVPLMSDPEPCPTPAPYSRIGFDINDALCPLPRDAQFVGWSDVARGQVARLSNGMAGVPQQQRRNNGSPNLGGLGSVSYDQVPMGGWMSSRARVMPQQIGWRPDGTQVFGLVPTGMGNVDAGLGSPMSFTQAVVLNVAIAVLSGVTSTLVYSKAKALGILAAGEEMPAMHEGRPRKKRKLARR